MAKFVVQTRNEFNPDPPHAQEPGTFHTLQLYGPFTDADAALSFIEDLHLARQAGNGTYEFILDAQGVDINIVAELDGS